METIGFKLRRVGGQPAAQPAAVRTKEMGVDGNESHHLHQLRSAAESPAVYGCGNTFSERRRGPDQNPGLVDQLARPSHAAGRSLLYPLHGWRILGPQTENPRDGRV